MATVFWLPSSGAAEISVTPSSVIWDGHINAVNRKMQLTRQNTALTQLDYAPDAADHLTDVATMIAQFISDILPPQTIAAQQILLGLRMLESNALNNLYAAWTLYAVPAAGGASLGNIVAIFKSAIAEMATAITGYCEVRAGSSLILNVPFRLVLEIGGDGLPVTGGGRHNFSAAFGDPLATGANNLPQSADNTACTPILLLSNDLKFLPAGKANYQIGVV
jgi:hypothetical protein